MEYIEEKERHTRIIEQLPSVLLEVIENVIVQAKILGVAMTDIWFGELPDGYMIAIPRIQRTVVVQGRILTITTSTHARTGYIDDHGEWKAYLKEAIIFEITDDGEQGKKNTLGEKVEMGHYLKSQKHTTWHKAHLAKKTEREEQRDRELDAEKVAVLLAAVRMQFPADMLCQIGSIDLMGRKVGNHTLAHIATMVGIPHFPQPIRRLALAAKVHGEHNPSVQKMMRGLRA